MAHDPAIREAVARGICNQRKPKPVDAIDAWALLNHWSEYGAKDAEDELREILAEATAALDAIEAAGCVVVPADPTPEMRGAGRQTRQDGYNEVAIWDAMVAARPGARP